MPAIIRGGPSAHRLPGAADAEAAEAALRARVPQGRTGAPPPPQPLPAELLDEGQEPDTLGGVTQTTTTLGPGAQRAAAVMATLRAKAQAQLPQNPVQVQGPPIAYSPMAELPVADEGPVRFPISGEIVATDDGVFVQITHAGKQYVGEGQSVTEAVSVAAGALEIALEQPRCPTCGQVLEQPEAGR